MELGSISKNIEIVNDTLKAKYGEYFNLSQGDFLGRISSIGELYTLEKYSDEKIKNLGLIVGVDGSVNRVGGMYPHYIEIYQSLAKPTSGDGIFLNEVYTPILDDEEEDKSNVRLASIEIDVAIEAVKKLDISILMMDGGLLRYKIMDLRNWEDLVNICEKRGVILCGIIKDIKSKVFSNALGGDFYDREILFGKLKTGELFLIDDQYNEKERSGLSTGFIRSSKFPGAIGMDILSNQRAYAVEVANLVYTLTPINSRGVPLWLDIVDREVKVTDTIMEGLLKDFLDRDIYERFFVSERDKRVL